MKQPCRWSFRSHSFGKVAGGFWNGVIFLYGGTFAEGEDRGVVGTVEEDNGQG